MARSSSDRTDGATAARTATTDDHATKESVLGTDRLGRTSNVSWGAIFAGVVTFLAVTVLLSIVTAAIGLGGSGTGAGIWSVVALALALAAGGYVAGALGVRSGLLHGFLTWATSVVAAVVLAVWLSASALGAVGGAIGQIASTATEAVSGSAVEETQENIDQEDVEQAEDEAGEVVDDAQQQAGEIADTAETGAWWTFTGMLLGAAIATVTGVLGARSVVTREETVRTR